MLIVVKTHFLLWEDAVGPANILNDWHSGL